MELPGADYSSQFRIILHLKPQLMKGTVLIKQFLLQVRAHIGSINVLQHL
jgi:hypothetical protein